MDRANLMAELERKAFDARVTLNAVCVKADVSPTVLTRWRKGGNAPGITTIGKIERALADIAPVTS